MAQFTIYTANDVGGPGMIQGNAGSLITILDACLVDGYSGKPAAGWTKPLPNTASLACYKQPSGSMMTLFINDAAAVSGSHSSGREAWATGWANLAALNDSGSQSVGSGSGQFPLPSQLLTSGHVVIKKTSHSDTGPTFGRYWQLWADEYTMYLFVEYGGTPGPTFGVYSGFMFGDIYSFSGPADMTKCMIIGRTANNSNSDAADYLARQRNAAQATPNSILPGHFLAGEVNEFYSKTAGKYANVSPTITSGVSGYAAFSGTILPPNPADGTFYVVPIFVHDDAGTIRGRLRGVYSICHYLQFFTDGYEVPMGATEYMGKSFRVVYYGTHNSGFLMETSDTVETN